MNVSANIDSHIFNERHSQYLCFENEGPRFLEENDIHPITDVTYQENPNNKL